MKAIFCVLLLFLININLIAQENPILDEFEYGYRVLQIVTDEESRREGQYSNDCILKVYQKISKDGDYTVEEVMSVYLSNDTFFCYYSFGPSYIGENKFVVIIGKYVFYIYNLVNDKLTGPLMPRYCGDYMDSQSGMLTGLDIIYEGAFLTGYLYDSRYFLYDFSDPDNPVEIYSIAPYCFSCKALFVVEFPAGSGRYNVIIVRSGENGEYGGLFYKTLLYSNLVFDQESITYIPPQGTWYHDEWPPEDHPYFKIETRYVFLKEILPDNQFRYLVIDMQEEMIVNFTIDTIGRSKEEIKQLLLHLEE